jgi:nucleoside-diphosphate-sugar epimerase
VAVFGGELPPVVQDNTAPVPQSSYGMQKALGELLVHDYSRRGFINGRVVRLPTIVVRPGQPNRATSTFASSIIREPLQGQEAICPVSADLRLWVMSPRRAVQNLIHAAELPAEVWGNNRIVSLPGLTVSVQQMIESLARAAGDEAEALIKWRRDPSIQEIVGSWPARFDPQRAVTMGFEADNSFDEIVRAFMEDELQKK